MIDPDIAAELKEIRAALSLIWTALNITPARTAVYQSRKDLEDEASMSAAKFKEKVHARKDR